MLREERRELALVADGREVRAGLVTEAHVHRAPVAREDVGVEALATVRHPLADDAPPASAPEVQGADGFVNRWAQVRFLPVALRISCEMPRGTGA